MKKTIVDNNYEVIAQNLKQQALTILEDSKIISQFAKYGKIKITGSLALDLMVWPDIDVQIQLHHADDRVKIFTDFSYLLLGNSNVRSVKLINFTPERDSKMPIGMYLGIEYKHSDNTKWKIDLWSLDQEDAQQNSEYIEKIQNRLNIENKQLILYWKHKILLNGRVPKMGSHTIYKAIIFENLTKDEDILDYLLKNNINLSHI